MKSNFTMCCSFRQTKIRTQVVKVNCRYIKLRLYAYICVCMYTCPSAKCSYSNFLQANWPGGIDSLESIPGLLKSLKIRALFKSNTPVHVQAQGKHFHTNKDTCVLQHSACIVSAQFCCICKLMCGIGYNSLNDLLIQAC